MSNFDGKHGEIANQSGVVIQTTHDIKDMVNRMRVQDTDVYTYPGAVKTLDTPTVRIDINDLVFRAGTSKAPRQNLLNNAIEVTSNLNGFYINKNKASALVTNPNDEDEILQALSESINFIGQALGATVPNPENEEDQKLQFTTRVQGTGHVMNTGFEKLVPGDTLYWDLFKSAEIQSDQYKKQMTRFGYSAKKVPLKTVPMSAAHNNFKNAIQNALINPGSKSGTAVSQFGTEVADALVYVYYLGLKAGNKKLTADFETWKTGKTEDTAKVSIGNSGPEFEKHVGKLLKGFLYVQQDLKRREIGKVLSYAAPGKGVDVLFGAN